MTDLLTAVDLLGRQQTFIDELVLALAAARAELNLLRALVDRVLGVRPVIAPRLDPVAVPFAPLADVLCVKCRQPFTPSPGRRTVCPPCKSALARHHSPFIKGAA